MTSIFNERLEERTFYLLQPQDLKSLKDNDISIRTILLSIYPDVFAENRLGPPFYQAFKKREIKILQSAETDNDALVQILEETLEQRKKEFLDNGHLDSFKRSLNEELIAQYPIADQIHLTEKDTKILKKRKKEYSRLKKSFVYFSPSHISTWLQKKTDAEIDSLLVKLHPLIMHGMAEKVRRLNQQFDSLTAYSLNRLLALASCLGAMDVIKKVIAKEGSVIKGEVFLLTPDSLGAALFAAIRLDYVEEIKELKSCTRFEEIDPNGTYSLGSVLCWAAIKGHVEAIEAIKSCLRFGEVNPNGDHSLGEALCWAAENGYVEVIEALKRCLRFGEVNPNGLDSLGAALRVATRNGHVKVIEEIKSCPQFGEINFITGCLAKMSLFFFLDL